jgi:hypothetical protein
VSAKKRQPRTHSHRNYSKIERKRQARMANQQRGAQQNAQSLDDKARCAYQMYQTHDFPVFVRRTGFRRSCTLRSTTDGLRIT